MKLISSYRHLRQKGFTLIELIIVLIIIGILAAIAVPQFLDLAGDAEKKAVEATATNINSAMTIQFGKDKLAGKVSITTCDHIKSAVSGPWALGSETAGSREAIVNPVLNTTDTYTIAGTAPDCTLAKNSVTGYTAKLVIPK